MRKKQIKSIVTTALAFSMVTSMGCSSSGNGNSHAKESSSSSAQTSGGSDAKESSTQGTQTSGDSENKDVKKITEGVRLTVLAPEHIRIEDYNTNDMTLKIENDLGVDLKFSAIPGNDYNDKVNVMINGNGDLPDIIFGFQDSWYMNGAAIPLGKYYTDPKMSPNIQEACTRTGIDIPKYLKKADGEIYSLPRFQQSYNGECWKKFWVYKPWLDKLNKEIPKTTEKSYEVLKLVAENDLNESGIKDEIGLSGTGIGSGYGSWFDGLMSSFIYAYDDEYRVLEKGKISFAYTSDQWKNGLKYIKKMFDDKLIPIETLTQNGDQYKAMLNSNPQTVFALNYWSPMMNAELMDRKIDYVFINALEGPDGLKEAMFKPMLPEDGACITTSCKNP